MKRNTLNNGQLPIIDWQFNRIAVKIGSNVLTRKDGTLDITRMSALVDQVAELHRKGVEVVLISSGAVASGRSEIKAGKKLDPVSARQLYSAVGQAKLINRYYELFREHGMTCGQVLTTKENFGSRTHYLNQKHCMEVMLENKVIPIVNENDTISVTELMFTDNDELSGLIATMMGMDALIILSNIDGIYNGNPSDPSSTVIREIDGSKEDLSEYVQTSKSSFGRGGMLTKCSIAQKVADEGITVIIANGKKDNILVDLLAKDSRTVCTRFIPSNKPVSSVKKMDRPLRRLRQRRDTHQPGGRRGTVRSEGDQYPAGRRHPDHRRLRERRYRQGYQRGRRPVRSRMRRLRQYGSTRTDRQPG